MNKKPLPSSAAAVELRRRAEAELQALGGEGKDRPLMTEIGRRVAARLRQQRSHQRSEAGDPGPDAQRLVHELQVHQVELEMQNAELQAARDRMEALVEKYTDLYDFAPVGHFTLDEQGRVLEVNLTGAALLGVERSQLVNRRLPSFVVPTSRPGFLRFLAQVFAGAERPVCEAAFLKVGGAAFWASIHARSVLAAGGPGKCCRVAVSDITSLKQAEEAQRRTEALTATNQELTREILRRQEVEAALRQSEQHQTELLERSRHMQEKLRHLSHAVLRTLEEERKRISRELHDDITQTLVGINVQLEALARKADTDPVRLRREIVQTQRLVEKSVNIVHQFARGLRPLALDELGVIPALHSFLKDFMQQTGIRVCCTLFAGAEALDGTRRTVLYRVVQEALTNVARHAKASRVDVSIQKAPVGVRLQIKDDGQSFNVDQALHARKSNRLGLIGMRERVEMVGGDFTIESAPGQGTTIQAQIPFGTGRKPRA